MSIEVKVPVLPESVSDAIIAKWHKQPGDSVRRDENLVDLETDKVVLEVPSPVDGVLEAILTPTGETVTSSQLIARIVEGVAAPAPAAAAPAPASAPVAAASVEVATTAPVAAKPAAAASATEMSPSVRRLVAENQIDPANVPGSGRGGRITKEDVLGVLKGGPLTARTEQRVPMTRLRARIADRMMLSKNSTAMLTSFNEVNMKAVMDLRKKYAEAFEKAHGVRLGFMSFFVKACTEALKMHPVVNASVDGNDIVYHAYQDIGVAVATEKGLVVPVLRSTDGMSLADVESGIAGFAKQAREGGLALDDLQGGTFTITNGGVFGSLFSTPIINPPQSAIFGMHAIKERAIVDNGQVIAAPMMYIALSYDHRIIDGKDAVLFLVAVKNFLEDPMRLMLHL
jgi:2-oxoglutarate dehydrogenase E2 component (dihydrolipoamide succinyltransferase)